MFRPFTLSALMGALLMTLPSGPAGAREKTSPMPESKPLTLERIFASPDLSGSQLRGLKISPDGRLVTLLRNRKADKDRYDLWAIDTASGKERMLVDSLKLGSGAVADISPRRPRARSVAVHRAAGRNHHARAQDDSEPPASLKNTIPSHRILY